MHFSLSAAERLAAVPATRPTGAAAESHELEAEVALSSPENDDDSLCDNLESQVTLSVFLEFFVVMHSSSNKATNEGDDAQVVDNDQTLDATL